jgi:hypothetical protein
LEIQPMDSVKRAVQVQIASDVRSGYHS